MKRTMRKIMSLAMAGSMIAAMGVTAFAAEGRPEGTFSEAGLDYAVELQVPSIEIELTANTGIVMNPYGLTFIIPGTDSEESTDDLYTAVNAITSRTQAPLDVDVTVTSVAPEGVSWASSAIANTSTEKEVFLQFILQAAADADVDATTAALSATGAPAAAPTAAPSAGSLSSLKAPVITLDGTEGGQSEGEDTYYFVMAAAEDAENPTFAQFQLVGGLNQKSETPWTADDAIGVSVAFTFNMMSSAQLN